MSRLHLAAVHPTTGALLPGGDWSATVEDLEFTTTRRGFHALTAFVPMALHKARRWQDTGLVPRILATANGETAFDGRLEDATVSTAGLRITAMGYWRNLADITYTSLLSETRFSQFEVAPPTAAITSHTQRFVTRSSGELYIAPKKNAIMGVNLPGGLTYQTPDDSAMDVQQLVFDYRTNAPTDWVSQCIATFRDGSSIDSVWLVTGTSGISTGTATVTFTAKPRITFRMYWNDTDTAYLGETGDVFLEITNIRIMAQDTATITARDVLSTLTLAATFENDGQLATTGGMLQEPPRDIRQLVVEDQNGLELAAQVEKDVTTALTGTAEWSFGVWEDRILRFGPWPSNPKTWVVDLGALEMTRSAEELANEVYAVYRDGTERTMRTAVQADAPSKGRYGLRRRVAIKSNAAADANAVVDALTALAGRSASPPRLDIQVEELYTLGGARVPLWMCRAGDTLVVRGLVTLPRITVGETRYSADDDSLEIAAEYAQPKLEKIAGGTGSPPVSTPEPEPEAEPSPWEALEMDSDAILLDGAFIYVYVGV